MIARARWIGVCVGTSSGCDNQRLATCGLVDWLCKANLNEAKACPPYWLYLSYTFAMLVVLLVFV